MRSSHSLTRKLSLQAQSPVDHKTNCKAQMILFTGYKKDIISKRNKLLDKLLDHSEVTLIVRSKTYLHFCFLKANSLIFSVQRASSTPCWSHLLAFTLQPGGVEPCVETDVRELKTCSKTTDCRSL